MRDGKNPFAYTHWGVTTIGFQVPGKAEPLWWTGQGFKNLAKVQLQPEEFADREAAEQKIRDELLEFIRRWRADQVELIQGW